MRNWRKFYWEDLGTNDAMYELSDIGYRVFTLLVMRQDDMGCFPKKLGKFRELLANTKLAHETESYIIKIMQELVNAKLIKLHDEHIEILICGKDKNGNLYKGRTPLLYNVQTMQNIVNPLTINDKSINDNSLRINEHGENELRATKKTTEYEGRLSRADKRT